MQTFLYLKQFGFEVKEKWKELRLAYRICFVTVMKPHYN